MSGRRQHRRLPAIPLSEWPELFASLGVASVVEIGLRTTTLPRLARLLGTPLSVPDPDARDVAPAEPQEPMVLPDSAQRQIRATMRILRRWPFGDTCLRQALISGQRMRRLAPSLHVGVARVDGEMRAHAWLVIHDRVVDPSFAASSYRTLTALPNRLTT